MKRIFICFLIIGIMLISACSNNDVKKYNYYYYGENDEWTAGMIYEAIEEFEQSKNGTLHSHNKDELELTVTYKGKESELSELKHMEIEYESSTRSGKETNDYNETDSRKLGFVFKSSGENANLLSKDEKIKITINMDGDIQSFYIKAK